MTKDQFDKLTEKYSSGNCSAEELTLLETWANLHFEYHTQKNVFQNEALAKDTEERLWQTISKDVEFLKPKSKVLSNWLWLGVAASIFITIGIYILNPLQESKLPNIAITGIESKNIAPSRQKIILPDGSTVTLEKGSKIITDEAYGQKNRMVYLKGEAFFDIKRNENKPFLVHSGDLVTEVLGTSFRIKPSGNSKTIEVSVKTGRVSVYADIPKQSKKLTGVIITPNQKVIFDTNTKTITQEIVDVPELIEPNISMQDFRFTEEAVETILPIIKKAYGVEIMVANPTLKHCIFTGDLNGLSLYKQLDLLCGAINASYEIRGTTIFLIGNGCKGIN